MRTSLLCTLASTGLLASLVSTTPLHSSRLVTNFHDRELPPRDDTLWPPILPDWPFPPNQTDTDGTAPKPETTPPAGETSDGREIHTRKELSKAFLDSSCSNERANMILAAWDEAKVLNKAQTQYQDGYPYDIPHTNWLGRDWNSEGSWWRGDPNYRQRIRNNFGRAMSVLGDDAPKHDYLYFSCKDIRNGCGKSEDGITTAYTWTQWGLFWSNHFIVFCEDFFQIDSMSELIAKYQDQTHEQKVMENFQTNRGGAMYHELFHKAMVGKPHIEDKCYGAQACYWITYAQGTKMASTNADSYVLDAIAIHVQQTYKSSMSPVPRDALKKLDPVAYAATGESQRPNYTSKALEPGGNIVVEPDKMPDPKDWKDISSKLWKNAKQKEPGTEPRGLKCLQKEWTAPKESTTDGSIAVKVAIEEFCKKRNNQKVKRGDRIYDRWDVSGLGISKRSSLWLSATTGSFDQCGEGTIEEKDCLSVLSSALNSCDKDQTYTTGALAQGEGCSEYAIEVSSSVHEGDPPWNQHVKMFPPPETVHSDLSPATLVDSQIVCSKERSASEWSQNDADAATEEYCGNDYAWSDGYNPMTNKGALKVAASWTNGLEKKRGYNGPYGSEDRDYCKGFESGKKSQDDCRYAFRKIIKQKLQNHSFCFTYYRCVGYMVIGGAFKDALNVEKANVSEGAVNTFTADNVTIGDGYMKDVIAKLGVKSFE